MTQFCGNFAASRLTTQIDVIPWSYVLLINIQFSSVFHLRWEFGAGQACCVGPVRERRSGKEHHHHRVSAGSQARGQEGEQETVTVTQLAL